MFRPAPPHPPSPEDAGAGAAGQQTERDGTSEALVGGGRQHSCRRVPPVIRTTKRQKKKKREREEEEPRPLLAPRRASPTGAQRDAMGDFTSLGAPNRGLVRFLKKKKPVGSLFLCCYRPAPQLLYGLGGVGRRSLRR